MANKNVETQEELNLDFKVTVKNLAGWKVTFARIDGVGDINIPPEGSVRLSRGEVISQVQNGNKLFTGIDGNGGHATLIVEDDATRKELGFDGEDDTNKQEVFSDDVVTRLFSLKTQNAFKKNFAESIKTRAEKYAVIQAIKRLKINDYSKIRFAEEYTGFKVQ